MRRSSIPLFGCTGLRFEPFERPMITLYRPRDSKRADEIQSRLEDMVAAHRVRPADEFEGPASELPAIDDSGDRYSGDAIEAFLRTLEGELQVNRMISSDACYIDPRDGETC